MQKSPSECSFLFATVFSGRNASRSRSSYAAPTLLLRCSRAVLLLRCIWAPGGYGVFDEYFSFWHAGASGGPLGGREFLLDSPSFWMIENVGVHSNSGHAALRKCCFLQHILLFNFFVDRRNVGVLSISGYAALRVCDMWGWSERFVSTPAPAPTSKSQRGTASITRSSPFLRRPGLAPTNGDATITCTIFLPAWMGSRRRGPRWAETFKSYAVSFRLNK